MLSLLLGFSSSLVPFVVRDQETTHAQKNITLPSFGLVFANSEEEKAVYNVELSTTRNYISIPYKFHNHVKGGKGYSDTRIKIVASGEVINQIGQEVSFLASEKSEDTIYFTVSGTSIATQEVSVQVTVQDAVPYVKPAWQTALLWVGICILALCSGAFSGLNISLLSIDLITLDIMQQCGNERQKKQAADIAALRTNDNILICTDLFGNTLVNTAMSVLLGETLSPFMGFIISSTVITLVGEILPQTFMYRYQIQSSYYLLWFVKFWYVVLFVVSYPLSWLLRLLFGNTTPQKLSRREFAGFIHEQMNGEEATYADDEKVIATNALELPDTSVATVACPNDKIFFVNESDIVNKEFVEKILNTGHSRIPVKNENNEVVWIILSKNLVYIDSQRNFKVADVMPFIGVAPKHILSDTSLYEALRIFIKAKSQLAVIDELVDDPNGGDPVKKFAGVISLSDILATLFKKDKVALPNQRQVLTHDLCDLFSNQGCTDVAADWLAQTLLMDKGIPRDAAPLSSVSGCSKYRTQGTKGDVLLTKGDVPKDLYIVLQGRVEFQNGEENVKSRTIPFAVFGAQSIYEETKPLNVSVVIASENCEFLKIPIAEVPRLDPNFKE